mgnify:CR=1 FL=1
MKQYVFEPDVIAQYLYRPVLIKPLENMEGILLAICMNKYGFEYQIRYYNDGVQKTEWFLQDEVVLNPPKTKQKNEKQTFFNQK